MQRMPLPEALAVLARLVREGKLGGSATFAADLCAKASRGLSSKQAEWVYRLIERATAPAADAPVLGDVAPILGLFTRAAAAGLRFPKIRLATPDGGRLVLALCGERSRTAGDIRATDGGSFHDGRYFGRIDRAGRWHAGRDASPAVLETLTQLAADPAGTASAYGRRSGSCCFCGRALDDGRSVAVGYGPVCADKFGLPWGELSAAPIAVDVAGVSVMDPSSPEFGAEPGEESDGETGDIFDRAAAAINAGRLA